MYTNTGNPLVSVTSSCKTGALLTGSSPLLNRRKLHLKHQFTCSRQKSGLLSKTNTELELHCSYLGFISLQYLRKIYFRIQGEGGWVALNWVAKPSLALACKWGRENTWIPHWHKKISSCHCIPQLHTGRCRFTLPNILSMDTEAFIFSACTSLKMTRPTRSTSAKEPGKCIYALVLRLRKLQG